MIASGILLSDFEPGFLDAKLPLDFLWIFYVSEIKIAGCLIFPPTPPIYSLIFSSSCVIVLKFLRVWLIVIFPELFGWIKDNPLTPPAVIELELLS